MDNTMLNIASASENESGVISLRDYIAEQAPEKPYKLIAFYNTGETRRDIKEPNTMQILNLLDKECTKLGCEFHYIDFVGTYIERKNGKTFLNAFEIDKKTGEYIKIDTDNPDSKGGNYQKPIEINPEDTILMPRDSGLSSSYNQRNRNWFDLINELELDGYFAINSLHTFEICASKNLTDIYFRRNNLMSPKTVSITHSADTERAFKLLDTDFPIVLKASTGTQTGVGVVIIESMRNLAATVEMLLLFDKNIPLIIQEYIKTDYDVRAMVVQDKVVGAMKRKVIVNDFRSNVSLGAKAEPIKLTELEEFECIKASQMVKGNVIGVDFIPAKNRETEHPYFLEVNSNAGLTGIEEVQPGITKTILKHFMNRDNWT